MITLAVEGISDEAIIRKVCETVGIPISTVYNCRGKSRLDGQLMGYNNAAKYSPWVVIRDLDNDESCAPQLRKRLLPQQSEMLLLRIPVRSIESWLLADREAIAAYLAVPDASIPSDPESLEHPKRELVNIARRSRKRQIREDIVPRPGLSVDVGPGYTERIIDFSENHWRPLTAAGISDSLARCIRDLRKLHRLPQ